MNVIDVFIGFTVFFLRWLLGIKMLSKTLTIKSMMCKETKCNMVSWNRKG